MKQYTHYDLVSIFKMNTRKRKEKMINTCVNRAIGYCFIAVKFHFLNCIYLACTNHI